MSFEYDLQTDKLFLWLEENKNATGMGSKS